MVPSGSQESLAMHMTRLVILGNSQSWYVKDLQRAAACSGGYSLQVATFTDLQLSSDRSGNISITSRCPETKSPIAIRTDNADRCDAILVRTMPLGSLEQVIFRMNVLNAAEHERIRVVNSPRTLEVAIDKWLTLDYVRRVGIEVPHTIVCQTRNDALVAFERLGGDVVVKPIFGGEGRGLIRVQSTEIAWRVFSTLEQLSAVFYLQEFLPHLGYDLRLLVIGEKIFCVERRAHGNEWRTNLALGAQAIPGKPTQTQIEIALRAAKAVQGEIIGVDILPTRDGRDILLEVNAVPGWKGTATALNRDIAHEILAVTQTP